MRCKKHLSDVSSAIGVCATCLRERLFRIVEAQSNPNSISADKNPNPNPILQSLSSKQEHPPPLIFPRSVSPYIARRKSDQTSCDNSFTNINSDSSRSKKKPVIQRFYSTPLVGPTTSHSSNDHNQTLKKKNSGKFGLISRLFRSKSTAAEVVAVGPTRRRNRGMSPQSEWDEEEDNDVAAAGPDLTRPSPGRVRTSHVTSLALCLSPLVRASPASRYHWGLEPTFSGEIRVPATGKGVSGGVFLSTSSSKEKPQLGDAASFCANRSRKIADFGRFNRKR